MHLAAYGANAGRPLSSDVIGVLAAYGANAGRPLSSDVIGALAAYGANAGRPLSSDVIGVLAAYGSKRLCSIGFPTPPQPKAGSAPTMKQVGGKICKTFFRPGPPPF